MSSHVSSVHSMMSIQACTSHPSRSNSGSMCDGSRCSTVIESPSSRKKRGLLATLHRKVTSRFGRKKDSDDVDCGIDSAALASARAATMCRSWKCRPRHVEKPIRPAYSDECLSCCAASRCMRSRSPKPVATATFSRHCGGFERANVTVEPACNARKGGGSGGTICKYCHTMSKDDRSPSEFEASAGHDTSQSEEEKLRDILPVDAEYGHASAPVDATCDVISTYCSEDSGSNSRSSCAAASSSMSHDTLTLMRGDRAEPSPTAVIVVRPSAPAQHFYDQVKENPKGWSLSRELFKLSKYGWYWGPITRVEAEEKLADQPDGAFLVRDSSDDRHLLSLSFRSYGRTLHTRIEHCNGVFSFYAQPESEGHSSIVDLIQHSMTDSQTGVFCYSRARLPGSPSFPVRLARPVSRFSQVRTLQYLCRFVIRQFTRVDHIQQLPLPTSIKGWLEENQY